MISGRGLRYAGNLQLRFEGAHIRVVGAEERLRINVAGRPLSVWKLVKALRSLRARVLEKSELSARLPVLSVRIWGVPVSRLARGAAPRRKLR